MPAAVGLLRIPRPFDATQLLADVSADEGRHYRTLEHKPKRARQYLASRWLLRRHLSSQLDEPPHSLPLQHHGHAAPDLLGSNYRISLSHSHDLCLCITAPMARVGCDVEHHRASRRGRAIATQYFRADEANHLESLDDEHALADFHQLWTLKEAAQKALGLGIVGGLQLPAFAQTPTLRCLAAPTSQPWAFAACTLAVEEAHYSLAVALTDAVPPTQFSVWRYNAVENVPAAANDLQWAITTTAPSATDDA